jgi:peroxiredoxin
MMKNISNNFKMKLKKGKNKKKLNYNVLINKENNINQKYNSWKKNVIN